ncbi:carbohydrate ABC transporter ATP-binding protein (CUT1 family) [Sinorhizobium medicae]|uniref:Glycerol-3-phosphate ABC transporter ATP-binding protein n=1 Tax=Sinorhizobium medicae TaxID=110321 RepID=A0A508WRM8_9HYPH|nr:sn-glycerol-3-phosphate ABC transporter ATP-binding protein UgpC [Sinorhizobium medicae]MBO1959826.1 sn-glycerol-3-phosphate ABC transporter ATP-binding protein UgpC [Sinorhizobium medicae]MQX96425.1 sn-glycerol-3-phosphate ABC transporter ATP-binding protein UgpC [Sinorhizobium medicae]PLT94077.1 glycerol-3-phosphate ABC transporter ATP-binding protein [Sinorhizobium medicae]PLU02651.1 glycerol-3-phosphate ABC transporter ATP-binding protein [Sinorhizobium medicae]PLU11965.1 glycerol-3-pho
MASITIKNIVKKFGELTIIPGLDLEIADEEFVVFVGPSGCGKSTLLRIIAGLEPSTSGELFIGDTKVNSVPASKRDIAMVFQDYALYPHMTVYDNMAFALELRGMTKAEIDQKVLRAASLLHIEPFLARKPKALSGGQRQRVAMGRAIVRDPKVFLFDEPLSNLDAKLRGQVRAEIKALSQELKTTMIFVTHDQIEAMTMADRIVVLKGGEIQQYGRPEEVYETPANQFVAGFIGSPAMNFFDIRRAGAGFCFADAPDVAAPAPGTPANTSEAVLGIRPEHFVHAPGQPGALPVTIHLVEPLGSDTLVHFDLAGVRSVARVNPELRPKAGQVLELSVLPGKAHLFDKVSGDAIR